MKILISSLVFTLTLCLGISSVIFNNFENPFKHDCTTWDNETLNRPLFTLKEANKLSGKKVRSKSNTFKTNEIGRIIHIEMVGQDKFFLAINWSENFDDEEFHLTFHDKEWFEKDFEVLD